MLLDAPSSAGSGSSPEPAAIPKLLAQREEFLRFLTRRVASPALAEDILQTAYVRALEQVSALRATESSTAWFYRILRNAVVDNYRRREVEDRTLAQWASELVTEIAPNDLTQEIVCGCIARVLPSLNRAYAEILQKVDLDEGTITSFAAAHDIKPANATVRLHRARKALKQRLIETCGACSVHGCTTCDCSPTD